MREAQYTAIILKKQPFKESDEIITFFTKEAGKVRALAKSVKSPKSKLQQKLQALFLVKVILAGEKLPKIISVESIKVFAALRENLSGLKRAFYAIELVLKFTPDEQKNSKLFESLEMFLQNLENQGSENAADVALAKFKLEALSALGINFNHSAEAATASGAVKNSLKNLEKTNFDSLGLLNIGPSIKELNDLLSAFIEYQLERRINSDKYLHQNMV